MADKTIPDYDPAGGIDAAADLFLIWQNSTNTYRKITRNVVLGNTGTPVDTSSIQTLQNKTLDNTNTITVKDILFTLQDDGDVTKQARFQLSGITTATTRTYTLPNASSTLADISTAQTFTNKTLTSPVITGGTITGSTITVDAIVGQADADSGTVYGITVTNGTIGSAALASSSVTSAKIADSAITPAKLLVSTGSSWVWANWTPTFGNLSGGAITYAKYIQVGKTVIFRMKYTLAGAGVAGTVTMSLPANMNGDLTAIGDSMDSTVQLGDTGTNQYLGAVRWATASTVTILSIGTAGVHTALSSTSPFTWANTDTIFVSGVYETT